MKILYNVTIIIDHSVHEEWLQWMRTEHIPAVMATNHFLEYKMSRILEEHQNADGVTYAIQYLSPNIETYTNYQQLHAPRLQQETLAKYNGKFAAFRTCMEVVDDSTTPPATL